MNDLLVRYIAEGNLDAIKALIKNDKTLVNTSINVSTSHTTYPLIYAAQHGHEAIVSFFLHMGANVHQTDDQDLTALDRANHSHFKSIETCIIDYKKHHALQEDEFSRAVLSGDITETQRYIAHFKFESSIMRRVISALFSKLKTEQSDEKQRVAVAFLLAKERGGLHDLIRPLIQSFDYDQTCHIGLGYLAKLYAMHQTHAFQMIIELGYPAINTIQLTLGRYPFNALQTALILYQGDEHHLSLVKTLLDKGHPLTFESNNWIKSLDGLSLTDSDHQDQDVLVSYKKNSFTSQFCYADQIDSTEQFYKKLNSIDYALKLAFFVNSSSARGLVSLLLQPKYTTHEQLAEIAGCLILSLQLKKRGLAAPEQATLIASEAYRSPMGEKTRAETIKTAFFSNRQYTQSTENFKTIAYQILSYFIDSSARRTDDEKKENMLNLKKKADNYLKDKDMDAALHCVTALEVIYRLTEIKTNEHHALFCSSMARKMIVFKSISPQLGYELLNQSFLALSKLPQEMIENKNYQWIHQKMKGLMTDINSFTKDPYETLGDFHQSTTLDLVISHDAANEKVNHFFSCHLKKCTRLTSLSLYITLGTPEKWDSFVPFISNLSRIARTIETLSLHIDIDDNNDYDDLQASDYDAFMETLSNKIKDNIASLSASFVDFKVLKKLRFEITPFPESEELLYATSEATSSFFETLPSDIMTCLTELTLTLKNNWFSEKQSSTLVDSFHPCTSLEELNIIDANYFDRPAQDKLGQWIGSHRTIKKVHFSCDQGEIVTLDLLIHALENQGLTDLVIKDFIFSDENDNVLPMTPDWMGEGYVSLKTLTESRPTESIQNKITTLGRLLKNHPTLETLTFAGIRENILNDPRFLTDHLFMTDFLFPLLNNPKITTVTIDLGQLIDRKVLYAPNKSFDLQQNLQKRQSTFELKNKKGRVLTIKHAEVELQGEEITPKDKHKKNARSNYFYANREHNLYLSRFGFLFSELAIETFKKELIEASRDFKLNSTQLSYYGCSFNFLQMMILLYNNEEKHFPFFEILGPALMKLDFNETFSSYGEERNISTYQSIDTCKATLDQKKETYTEEAPNLSDRSFFEKMNFIDNALKLAIVLHPHSASQLIAYLAEKTQSLADLAESTVLFLDRSFSRTLYHGCSSSSRSQLIVDSSKLQAETLSILRQKNEVLTKRSTFSAADPSVNVEIKSSIFYHPHHAELDEDTRITAQRLFSIVAERSALKRLEDLKNEMVLLNKKSMNFLSKKDYDAASLCSKSTQLIYSMIQNPTMVHHELMIQACVNNILSLKAEADALAEIAYTEGTAFLSALFTSLSAKERRAMETSTAYQFIYRTLPSEASIYSSEDFKRSTSTPYFFSPVKNDRETCAFSPVSSAITNSGDFAKRGPALSADLDESEIDDDFALLGDGLSYIQD